LKVAQELLRVAEILLAGCSVTIENRRFRKAVNDQIEELSESIWRSYEENLEPYTRSGWLRKFQEGLKRVEDEQKAEQLEALALGYLKQFESGKSVADYKRLATQMNQKSREILKEKDFSTLGFTRVLHDFVDYVHAQYSLKHPEEEIKDIKKEVWTDYKKHAVPVLRRVTTMLKKFCSATGQSFAFEVALREPDFRDSYLTDVMKDPSLSVKFKGRREPDFTLFVEGNKFDPEDVLSFGDADFFEDMAEQKAYFDLVEYFRSGKLPEKKQGFLKLYRGMSVEEYQNWQRGQKIPAGKYFTSDKTSALAMDISGEYPELFSFMVDASIVAETDRKTFQLTDDAKLRGKKIVPA